MKALTLAAAALGSIVALSAQASSITRISPLHFPVQSYLVTSQGEAVADARVELIDSQGTVRIARATDSRGKVSFYGSGKESVRVTLPGGAQFKSHYINTH
ncbi:MAG: hypothetical protein ACR2PT_20850 [Endozoicomonas sp.]